MPPKEDRKGKARARSLEPTPSQQSGTEERAFKESKKQKQQSIEHFAVPRDLDRSEAAPSESSELDLDPGNLFAPKKAKLEGFVPRKLPRPAPKFLQRPWLMPRVKPITPMKPLWNSVGNRTVYLAPSLNSYLQIPNYARGMGAPP